MKAKKLVGLAIPVMLLLGGCGTDKAEEKKTDSIKVSEESSKEVSKTDSKETSKVKAESQAEKEYKTKLNSLMADLTKQAQVLNGIINSGKQAQEIATEYTNNSDPMLETADKLSALDPGEKYKDVQDTVQKAMFKLKSGTLTTKTGLNLKNADLVKQGGETTQEASTLIFEVDKKMKETK